MKVEILIYSYRFICVAMIIFNIICVFEFKREDRKLKKDTDYFKEKIEDQIKQGYVDDSHKDFLHKRLSSTRYLRAFDNTMDMYLKGWGQGGINYLEELDDVFIRLLPVYMEKQDSQKAFFPYIINKYKIYQGEDIVSVNNAMFLMLRDKNVYCRINAINAIYSMGVAPTVITALKILDHGKYTHHKRVMTDGILDFSGNRERLNELLWENLESFTLQTQISILDYFRFSNCECCEQMYQILISDKNQELIFSAIRYFGKFKYEPAYEYIMQYAENPDEYNWEYPAITATSLANYPNERTIAALKGLLCNSAWYVRYNASRSVMALGLEYVDLVDVIDGRDKYAGEILRYRMEQKKLQERGNSVR